MAGAISLSERQSQAVEHGRGPMLVVAGAGTGKTTVLVERIARLIESRLAAPGEILAITYTRNAARELRERVDEILQRRGVAASAEALVTTNFHTWSNQVLLRAGRGFGVLDEADLWIYLRRKLDAGELPLRRFLKAASPAKFLEDLLTFFSRCHDELADAARYQRYVDDVAAGDLPLPRVAGPKETLERDEAIARCREIAAVFRAVEEMLAREDLGTFGHMILHAIQLLRDDPALLARERSRARFLLIDEFQDANFAQIELASLLAGEERNLFAVGDPDQAIYQFRGASSAAFDEFQRRYPDTAIVNLVENRRSTTPILAAAFAAIAKNPQPGFLRRERLQSARESEAAKKGKPLRPQPVDIVYADAGREAADIAGEIAQRQPRQRCRCRGQIHAAGWCNFAVLYRQHSHRERVITELAARSIPFVVSGQDVRDTGAVRDAVALLRVLASSADSVSLARVAALERFRVSPQELRLALATQPRRAPLAAALERIEGGREVLDTIAEVRGIIASQGLEASAVLDLAVRRFALPESEPLAILRDFVRRWENKPTTVERSNAALVDYLDRFFECSRGRLGAEEDTGEGAPVADAVRLMTAHAAKGLEFTDVFVVRVNPNSFPRSHTAPLFEFPAELREYEVAADEKTRHDEEERRLFYVALTRARDGLTVSAKQGRSKKDPRPPGFVRDVLEDRTAALLVKTRPPRPLQLDLEAAASAEPVPAINQWVSLPASPALQQAALSASSIAAYQRCPLQFKLERDWKLPTDAPAALRFGAAMHTAMKAFFDGVLAGARTTAEELITIFREELSKEAIGNPLQARLYDEAGARQLQAFVERQSREPLPEVVETERKFEVRIEGLTVTGRIDRVDRTAGGVAIVDYKTGTPWTQEKADESLQLSLYAIAAARLGMKAEMLVIHNLENDTAIGTRRSPEELAETAGEVQAVAAGIAAGDFEPKPDRQVCPHCAYRAICPATERRFHAAAGAVVLT